MPISRHNTTLRLTVEESKLLREAASHTGETVASFIRRSALAEARRALKEKK